MSFVGQEEQIREFQNRFRYFTAAVLVGIGLLASRMVYLQVLRGDEMRQYSDENSIKKVKIPAPRGMIFDRSGKLLIDNRPSFDVEIIPQYLRESKRKDEIVAKLASLIGMTPERIHQILNKASQQPRFIPVKIKMDLSRDEVAYVESWKIAMPGVQITQEIERTNIYGDIAAHLLGYIGEINATELPKLNQTAVRKYKLADSTGKSGLEKRHEETLRGIDGEKLVEVDAVGRIKRDASQSRVLASSREKAATPGKNLFLTIDQDLQLAAAQAFGDKVGGAVAIDPRTGEVLAMVSRPSFDPTEFSRGISSTLWKRLSSDEHRPLRDKTIQDHYSPGSVFKIITAIAGLEEGVIDAKTTFGCGGKMSVGNRVYHCHKKEGHGEVDVVAAIIKSCDVFFYRTSQRLGVDKIAKWAFYLGLGKRTGINLANEVSGLIPTEAWKMQRFGQEWNAGETLSVAIGQSYVLTSALQLANSFASIANGGTLFRPYLIRRVESFEGEVLKENLPDVMDTHKLKPETMELIKQGLWGVVNGPGGTALSQRLPGMDFVGKTGTVQVIRLSADKIYQKCENMKWRDRHHGMFAGYAPATHPKIAVAVIAEHACHGSSGAAPIAKAIVKVYLEKHYPELYGVKAVQERLRGEKIAPTGPMPPPEEEDLVPGDAPGARNLPPSQPDLPDVEIPAPDTNGDRGD
jgi:penicillin-binding protein 2